MLVEKEINDTYHTLLETMVLDCPIINDRRLKHTQSEVATIRYDVDVHGEW